MVFEALINSFGLFGLFVVNLLSASILPFPSEPAIIFSLAFFSPIQVFFIALIGNILGNITNYYIGLKGLHGFLVKRDSKLEKKAQKWFKKWGNSIVLVAPWIPFIGDPLMIVAGALQMDFKKFLIYITVSRIIKVYLLIFLGIEMFAWLGI